MNIKELRLNCNMTQKEFALRFHIPVRTLQEWEQNRATPPSYVIELIFEIVCKNKMTENNFAVYKSQIKHILKRVGDLPFIINIIEKNYIASYFNNGNYNKSLYLLAMLDTLCIRNNLPLCSEYNEYRKYELKNHAPVFDYSESEFLPEFLKYNIWEVSIDNVC